MNIHTQVQPIQRPDEYIVRHRSYRSQEISSGFPNRSLFRLASAAHRRDRRWPRLTLTEPLERHDLVLHAPPTITPVVRRVHKYRFLGRRARQRVQLDQSARRLLTARDARGLRRRHSVEVDGVLRGNSFRDGLGRGCVNGCAGLRKCLRRRYRERQAWLGRLEFLRGLSFRC